MSKMKFSFPGAVIAGTQPVTTPPSDPIQTVSDAIKHAIRDAADPYILAGCMIEGIAMTLLSGIPPEKQADVANDLLVLLYARLDSLNMIAAPGPEDGLRARPVGHG